MIDNDFDVPRLLTRQKAFHEFLDGSDIFDMTTEYQLGKAFNAGWDAATVQINKELKEGLEAVYKKVWKINDVAKIFSSFTNSS
jgi:hypothetical protein